MAITEMFLWWYSRGWGVFVDQLKNYFASIVDFFSMDSLFRTLFKPFRQISAESASANSSIDLKFQMFLDRLISRTVGFFSRLILILVGVILMICGGVLGLVLIVLWPIIPLLPIGGILLTILGVIL
ncbi:hypothetical protein IKG41_01085 [Candidatus Saccharibacteria bacterium]|nr:hypothetical protein [Candidatus Saccharibacteria bacterium]